MTREQLIADRESDPRAPAISARRFRELHVALSLPGYDVFDTRVFRDGLRADGDPTPFHCWVQPNCFMRGESVDNVREQLARHSTIIDASAI